MNEPSIVKLNGYLNEWKYVQNDWMIVYIKWLDEWLRVKA